MKSSKSVSYGWRKIVIVTSLCSVSVACGFALGAARTGTFGRYRVGASQASAPQQPETGKVVERAVCDNEPFEFSDLAVRNLKVMPNGAARSKLGPAFRYKLPSDVQRRSTKDAADDYWLENLEFSIKNTSPNEIISILVEIAFPETEQRSNYLMLYNLTLGIPPNASSAKRVRLTAFSLPAGETYNFTLRSEELEQIKAFLANGKFELSDLNSVVIRIAELSYRDGVKWAYGHYFKPNAAAPGGYELIKP